MKKIFWTSIVWIALVILFWAYVRLFNPELGTKISYCFLNTSNTTTQTWIVDYSADITTINTQLLDIQDKVENILQTLGTSNELPGLPVAPTSNVTNTATPYDAINPLIQQ